MGASHVVLEEMGFLGQRHPLLDLPCVELTGQRIAADPKVSMYTLSAYIQT